MKIKKYIEIYDKIYHQNYWICYGYSIEEFKKFLKDNNITDISNDIIDNYGGLQATIESEYGTSILIWTKKQSVETLLHELIHASLSTFEGIRQDVHKGEEAYAYYVQYLYTEALNKINKKGKNK